MSYDSPDTAPKKPGAATPTTVKGCELILSCRPITPASQLNRRCQYAWLNTTVAGAPGVSSCGVNPRPTLTDAPSTSKKFAVTICVHARSASRSTTTPTDRSSNPVMPETCFAALRNVLVVGIRKTRHHVTLVEVRELHELLGARRARHRIEQHRVDPAEDRRVRADAEREHQHGDGGETGVRRQRSERVAQILNDGLHEGISSRRLGPATAFTDRVDEDVRGLAPVPAARLAACRDRAIAPGTVLRDRRAALRGGDPDTARAISHDGESAAARALMPAPRADLRGRQPCCGSIDRTPAAPSSPAPRPRSGACACRRVAASDRRRAT